MNDSSARTESVLSMEAGAAPPRCPAPGWMRCVWSRAALLPETERKVQRPLAPVSGGLRCLGAPPRPAEKPPLGARKCAPSWAMRCGQKKV